MTAAVGLATPILAPLLRPRPLSVTAVLVGISTLVPVLLMLRAGVPIPVPVPALLSRLLVRVALSVAGVVVLGTSAIVATLLLVGVALPLVAVRVAPHRARAVGAVLVASRRAL